MPSPITLDDLVAMFDTDLLHAYIRTLPDVQTVSCEHDNERWRVVVNGCTVIGYKHTIAIVGDAAHDPRDAERRIRAHVAPTPDENLAIDAAVREALDFVARCITSNPYGDPEQFELGDAIARLDASWNTLRAMSQEYAYVRLARAMPEATRTVAVQSVRMVLLAYQLGSADAELQSSPLFSALFAE